MRRLVLALILAGALVPVSAQPASACSCAPLTRTEYAENADVVVTGRVRTTAYQGRRLIARFRVMKVYKGAVRRRVEIRTASDSSACGCTFRTGKRYTVFADRYPKRRLSTSLCSGTKPGGIDPGRYGLPSGRRP